MPAKATPYLISPYASRPSTPWKLELRASFAGKRIKKYFATKSEAEAAAAILVSQVKLHGSQSLIRQNSAGIPLSAVLATFRQHKFSSMSGRHLKTATHVYKAVEEKFGATAIDSITPLELERWIHSRGNSPTTGARYFRYIRMFWRWAYKKQLVGQNTIERVDSPIAKVRLNILTPEQMKALLALDCPKWLHFAFLFCGFAGLRTEELLRMNWSSVFHDEQSVHVARGVQKNSGGWAERYVDFTDPIRRRVKDLQESGKFIPVLEDAFYHARANAARSIGLKQWPANCLRHSFASYHLALHGDAGKTGHQMGHTSSAMVYRTYAQAVRKSQAEAWWAL